MAVPVDTRQLALLDARSFVLLLRKLIYQEAAQFEILSQNVGVTTAINIPDDGEDAHVQWEDGVAKTDYFPKRDNLFQFKADSMPPNKCAAEVRNKDGGIKARVKEIVERGGAYIVVCSRKVRSKRKCKDAIREAFVGARLSNAKTATIVFLDGDDVAKWIDDTPSATAFVRNRLELANDELIESWTSWSRYEAHLEPYQTTPQLTRDIEQLRQDLSQSRMVVRLVGLSGLGKTRLALETFRPPENPSQEPWQQVLSDRVVYCRNPTPQLSAYVRSIARTKREAIFVIDNCTDENHHDLSDIVRHQDSSVSLITLDHVPKSTVSHNDRNFELKRQPDDVIKGIVRARRPDVREHDLKQICEYANGFPQIAVLLAESGFDDQGLNPNVPFLTQMTHRLLFGRKQENESTRHLMSALAIFDYVGFTDGVRDQLRFVAEVLCADRFKSADEAATHLSRQQMFARELVQRRGRYIQVAPYPLAVALAREWWETCPDHLMKKLFGGVLPDPLVESMCRRFRLMDVVDKARELVTELCGTNGPFSNREQVLSEVGSRLLKSMAEVNRQPVLGALEDALRGYSSGDYARVTGNTRLNIVRTLQLLAWWPDTFSGAARLLLRLAESADELYADNSKELFIQLFRSRLSGTETPFNQRTPVLNEALASDNHQDVLLALEAVENWFSPGEWMRMGGPEQQGSRPSRFDWAPKSEEEWSEGVHYALNAARRFMHLDGEVGDKAREVLDAAVMRLLYWGKLDLLRSLVKEVTTTLGQPWASARKTLEFELVRGEDDLPPEAVSTVEELLEYLAPQSLKERLHAYVVEASDWRMRRAEDGNWENLDETRARDLAKELAANPDEFIAASDILLQGQQPQAGSFGETFGHHVKHTVDTFTGLLSVFKSINDAERNPSLLMGMMRALEARDADGARRLLSSILRDEDVAPYLPFLVRSIRTRAEDLQLLVKGFETNAIPSERVWASPNGSVLQGLPLNDFVSYMEALITLGLDAQLYAIDAYHFYLYNNKESVAAARPYLKNLLRTPGLLLAAGKHSQTVRHGYETLLEHLLEEQTTDASFSEFIFGELVNALHDDEIRHRSQFTSPIVRLLVVHAKEVTLPLLVDQMAEEPYLLGSSCFGPSAGWGNENPGLLALVSTQELVELAMTSKERAISIARVVPTFATELSRDQQYTAWSSISIVLLDEYGSDEDVRRSLDHGVLSMAWSGSAVPGYENRLKAVRQLLKHPNQEVQNWAASFDKYFRSRIEQESKRDEERDAGIR